jgi:hypothetical protein
MADALAAAVERLRARAEASPPLPDGVASPDEPDERHEPAAPEPSGEPTAALQARPPRAPQPRVERPAPVVQRPTATDFTRAPHRHSMSWFAWRRMKRKLRRERRAQ